MFLTIPNLAHYLMARGLATPASLVAGDFQVVEAGRRNRNFKVIRRQAPGLFVKQIRAFEAQAVSTLQREAACYQLASSRPEFAPLANLMPHLIDYDPGRFALTLELLPDAENLTEFHRRTKSHPLEIGQMLGRGLGAYHSDVGRLFSAATDLSMFPRQVPWILSLHLHADLMRGQLSAGNVQLVEIVRRYPEFQQRLDRVRAGWHYDSLIHGDIKWDNCLVFRSPSGALDFRIVDWELADFGDALWDVGAVLQTYVAAWVCALPFQAPSSPEQAVAQAPFPLSDIQAVLRAFWQAYVAARGFAPAQVNGLLERCVAYAAARMVQTAFELLYSMNQLAHHAVLLLQMSLNILNDPVKAQAEVFGLATPSTSHG